jgi:hypothetical protein
MGLRLVTAALLTAACASNAPPAAQAPARAAASDSETPRLEAGPSFYQSEIGGLSQYDVEHELGALEPELLACVQRAADDLSYLGGRVSLRMRLDPRGNVRWAYLNETTLGDREAERCVLSTIKARTWPRPMSGEGLAETSFDVDAADPPTPLPSYEVAALAERARAVTRKCRKGIRGDFVATAYFARSGKVLSVGVAPPDETGEPAADCVADALRGLRVAAHGPASKASFRISP